MGNFLIFQSRTMSYFELVSRWRSVPKRLYMAARLWKIFYFQPGHETNPSYHNPYVLKVIENAVRWAAPVMWRENLECPNIVESPESKYLKK